MTKDLVKMRAALAARVAELRAMTDKIAAEKRNPTDEERKLTTEGLAQADRDEREIADAEREEQLHALEARMASSTGTLTRSQGQPAPGAPPAQSGGQLDVRAGQDFKSLEDFICCIVENRASERLLPYLCDIVHRPDQRARLERREMNMASGAAGGFLVPTQFIDTLLMLKPEEAIMRPRCQAVGTVIPSGPNPDAPVSMPALKQGADGVFSGVTVTWTGEGGTVGDTDAELDQVTLIPQEVTANVILSAKLLRNAPAGGLVTNLLRQAVAASEDYQFLRGNGDGKPMGVLSAKALKKVARATASQISYADLVGMLAGVLPDSLNSNRLFWAITQSAYAQIMQLEDTEGHNIAIAGNIRNGEPDRLLNRPIVWTGRLPALGTLGDILAIDPLYYLIKDGWGPVIAISDQVHWSTNKIDIKIVRSVDGQPWVYDPLKLEGSTTTCSPYVGLNA